MFYTNTCSPVKAILGSMLALFEAWLIRRSVELLSGPRIGQRLSATRFGRWIERKAGDSTDRRPSRDS